MHSLRRALRLAALIGPLAAAPAAAQVDGIGAPPPKDANWALELAADKGFVQGVRQLPATGPNAHLHRAVLMVHCKGGKMRMLALFPTIGDSFTYNPAIKTMELKLLVDGAELTRELKVETFEVAFNGAGREMGKALTRATLAFRGLRLTDLLTRAQRLTVHVRREGRDLLRPQSYNIGYAARDIGALRRSGHCGEVE